jgi:hypothetical protein
LYSCNKIDTGVSIFHDIRGSKLSHIRLINLINPVSIAIKRENVAQPSPTENVSHQSPPLTIAPPKFPLNIGPPPTITLAAVSHYDELQ